MLFHSFLANQTERSDSEPMSSSKPSWLHRLLNIYFRIICILAVDLIISLINAKILSMHSNYHKTLVTAAGMLVVLLLVLFLFSIIDRLTKFVLKVTVEMGNFLGFRKTMIFLILSGMLVAVYSGYHYVWFGSLPDYGFIYNQTAKSLPTF